MFKNAKAKHGLNLKMGFKTKFGLILENQTVEREGRRKREKKRKRKRKKKRRRGEAKIKKVWILWILYGIVWITWISCIDTCLWVGGCVET